MQANPDMQLPHEVSVIMRTNGIVFGHPIGHSKFTAVRCFSVEHADRHENVIIAPCYYNNVPVFFLIIVLLHRYSYC